MDPTAALPRTVIDRIWDDHVVAEPDAGHGLLYIDRVLLHERTGPALLAGMALAGRKPRDRSRVFGCMDHIVDTSPDRLSRPLPTAGAGFITAFRDSAAAAGIRVYDLHDPAQGIVHVVSPEQGIALPGLTLVCPDSHTGTVGGLGALAWGIGSTEGEHAVATMTLLRPRCRRMRVSLNGRLPAGVFAKDLVLALIARFGATGGDGCAIEFAGEAVRALDVEGRMTLCNMAVEFGAWTGLVAPDDRTIEWVAGRPLAPRGVRWDQAVAHWRTLRSDEGAHWDAELALDASALAPQVTWGTSPEHGGTVDTPVPDPAAEPDAAKRQAAQRALQYMGLAPGRPLRGLPVGAAFIGSCTNARLPDLRAAAAVLRGRHVAPGVRAIVVPGSMAVRAAAEAEGLHRVFTDAGFEWRASGCSMCFFSGADSFGLPEDGPRRAISSTNRNFEGRQGPGVRTHLASPATVAASAVAGCITDAGEPGMTALTHVDGVAAALLRDNIDTDVIIPSREITSPGREGYGAKLFAPWRYLSPGGPENPDFVLNRGPWRQARILVTGRNFGCGSSREMAVWAIAQFGIACIVAPSFGAIFRDNCVRNAVLPVLLPEADVAALAAEAEATAAAWHVDVAAGELRTAAGRVHRFTLDDGDRQRLLTGHDAVALTLQAHGAAIDDFEARDRRRRPWAWPD